MQCPILTMTLRNHSQHRFDHRFRIVLDVASHANVSTIIRRADRWNNARHTYEFIRLRTYDARSGKNGLKSFRGGSDRKLAGLPRPSSARAWPNGLNCTGELRAAEATGELRLAHGQDAGWQ